MAKSNAAKFNVGDIISEKGYRVNSVYCHGIIIEFLENTFDNNQSIYTIYWFSMSEIKNYPLYIIEKFLQKFDANSYYVGV